MKTVVYYADLYPGWQDGGCGPCLLQSPGSKVLQNEIRVKVTVELPEVFFPAAVEVNAKTERVAP
jgi:hypothetical protein